MLDTGEFIAPYRKEEWDYLATGVLIETTNGELFHFPALDDDEDVELLVPPQ